MKKWLPYFLIVIMSLCLLGACTPVTTEEVASEDEIQAQASGMTFHKIGVASYSIKDAQVRMFKDYLDNYIKACFPDVSFYYSDTINGGEELMEFLQSCADQNMEGVMVFGSYDLKKEVEFCAEHEMYYIRPSATSSDEDFKSVEMNPYFVGEIGPGIENEYIEAEKMTRALAGEEKSYVILTGGASSGNVMHQLRSKAIFDTLAKLHDVELPETSEKLAMVTEVTSVSVGELELIICPGYLEMEENKEAAVKAINEGSYTTILSAVPVTDLLEALDQVPEDCGTIDCFSQENYYAFQEGTLDYVAGKYQSEIGPGFAALYNAITGYAEASRTDGKALRLVQGFWTAESMEEYDTKYALASGAAVNAYNYEDLQNVMYAYNPETDFESFQELVEDYDYEACLKRREN